MFCEKNKLQALTRFCSSDNTRPALKNVRFENGDTAFATNGHAMAIAKFPQTVDLGVDPPVQSDETPFSVSADAINKAFKNTPKKSPFLHTQGVFVAKNTAAAYSDVRNCAKYREETDQNFPNVHQVIPKNTPDDTVLALSKECLETLVSTMKSCKYSAITLRIPIMGNKGYTCNAVGFSMGKSNENQVTGLVMPCIPEENERNNDCVPVSQSEIGAMLDVLCELAPDDTRVQAFAEKYSKLASTTESMAA